jgi:hypothetical protein
MAEDQKPGPWVEIWEQCEHCNGTGIEPETFHGLREGCTARCNNGKSRKLFTFEEFHDLLHVSKEPCAPVPLSPTIDKGAKSD